MKPIKGQLSALDHGGNLLSASQQYHIPVEDWLDLSTGINPCSYPVNGLPANCFNRLPYQNRAFLDAVSSYYGAHNFVATNGSQQMIQLLPNVLDKLPVVLPDYGYQEHARAWMLNGSRIEHYPALDMNDAQQAIEFYLAQKKAFHLVVINPNNPTGLCFAPKLLAEWAEQLPAGAKLIIDEAFVDATPEASVIGPYFRDNMIVLRSFGKFFGLAGLRLGFTFANDALIKSLKQHVSVWDVNGPAQAVATDALGDSVWQTAARDALHSNAKKNADLFAPIFSGLPETRSTLWQTHQLLFSSYGIEKRNAGIIYDFFAHQGVLLRTINLSNEQSLLRVGRIDFNNRNNVERLLKVRDEFLRCKTALYAR